jgi:ribose transport system substrate-binding protein
MSKRTFGLTAAFLALCTLIAGLAPVPARAEAPAKKYKILMTIGFDGNTWMNAAQNLVRAIAKTKKYEGRVAELTIQSARADAQVQAQQINAAVEGGVDIIVLWPFSPTALNRAVRNACAHGVTVVTFDGEVTEPCAYHIGIDQVYAGAAPAEWLADALKGKGNIVFMDGVPGNLVNTQRAAAAKDVFSGYPDIKIVADTPSMWNEAIARQKLQEIVAAKGWDAIDGVWTQVGCYQFAQLEIEAGRKKLLPCAGNGTNGERIIQLAKGATEGALDAPGASMGSPPFAAPLAFVLGIKIRDGETVPKVTRIAIPLVTGKNTVLCQTGDRAELMKVDWKCNGLPLSVASATYYMEIWTKELPELDVNSALNGIPAEGQ